MTVSTFLLQTVTPAILPACDAAGYEYYDVLGLQKYSALSEIRKAYKVKSLKLHPDKIQQKRGDAAAAAAEYERVQEAYAVLSDDHKRAHYHAWKCSVARYLFIENNHGLSNPVAMHENLMTAGIADKSRLLVLSTVLIVIVLLQPILIASKVNGISNSNGLSNTSWVVILIPLWIFLGLYVGAMVVATGVVLWTTSRKNEQTNTENSVAALLLATGESIAWLVGIIMLARQWDRSLENKISWHVVSIPFYIAVLIRMAAHLLQLRQIRTAQRSMVSTEYLQQKYEGTLEEIDDEILSKHIVVTTDTSAVVVVLQVLQSSSDEGNAISDEDVEAVRVQTSPEFRASEKAAQESQIAIGRSVILYITMIALIAAKLQNQIDASWWVVFVPVWVCLGLPFLKHLIVCLCVGPPLDDSDEDIVEINIGNDDDNKKAKAVKESINLFASAEGAMDEFNNNDEDIMAEPELLARRKDSDDDGNNNNNKVGKETADTAALESGIDEPSSDRAAGIADAADKVVEVGGEQLPKEKAELEFNQQEAGSETDIAEEKKETDKTETDQDDKNKSVGDDDDEPHVDEESFRRWQQRLHAEESDFVEQKFKAFTGCCCYCFQIIILCLIVGKIEQDYGDGGIDGGTQGDGGYSAFWILFPVFLVSGVILLCCSICIYGTTKEKPVGEMEDKPDREESEEVEVRTIIPAAPAETTEPSNHGTAAEATITDIPEVAAAPTDEEKAETDGTTGGLAVVGGATGGDTSGETGGDIEEGVIDMDDLD